MIAPALLALPALLLLAVASRRPAERLGLSSRQRKAAKWVAAGLLLAAAAICTGHGGGRAIVAWVLLLGVLVPPIGMAFTRLAKGGR
jgi:hypothetical protein